MTTGLVVFSPAVRQDQGGTALADTQLPKGVKKSSDFGYTLAGGDFTGPSGFAWMVSFEV
ncbi:unnamed protein product [marine sediment metagenome]|uniref:Uncharacterized protein n=1 Tax=marine sediment metagenome TaxID=412755 RepID=X1UWE0_9ZZZZ